MSQYNECQISYMLANGATSSEKGLCTRQFLLHHGAADGCLGDMWLEFLSKLNYKGSRTGMESKFWRDHGCGTAHGTPFPDMSHNVIRQAFIEDGVDGTILSEYTDLVEFSGTFNKDAFSVWINDKKVTVLGVGEDLGNPGVGIEITFSPEAVHGDHVRYQYDPRIDPGFTDSTTGKSINFAMNGVGNQIAA